MHRHIFAAAVFVLGSSQVLAQDVPANISPMMGCEWGSEYYISGPARQSRVAPVTVVVADARPLIDQNNLMGLLNRAATAGFTHCPANNVTIVTILSGGVQLVKAWFYRVDGQWRIVNNSVAQFVQQQDARNAQIAAQQQAAREAQLRQQAEAAAREKRRQAALADCGSEATFSGGPWFSSTYKMAATDMGRRRPPDGRFLCVKTIEYIGAAVNPFGGNAARAKFIGYDAFTFQPLSMVMDFPY
jgi:hypothetical protein